MMSIPSLVWRPRARIVAIIDLLLSILGLVFTLISAIFLCLAVAVVQVVSKGFNEYNRQQQQQQSQESGQGGGETRATTNQVTTFGLWIVWLGVAGSGVLTGIQCWAAWRLLKATDLRRTREEAVKHIHFWLILTIVMLVIWVPLQMGLLGAYLLGSIGLVLRLLLIIVVYQFLVELKQAIHSAHAPISKVAPI